jgi:2-dehydro-3-deoxygluconokinase
MNAMPDLVTFGETSAVFVARDVGRMRYCREYTLRPGGAEATVAVGVQRLGFSAGWMSALGDDEMGHYLRGFVAAEGVDVSRVRMQRGLPTAVFLRERLSGGDARHFYYRKGSAFSSFGPQMLDEDYIAGARRLHLTGISPALSPACDAACWRAVEVARAHGVLVSFDPNVRLSLWTAEEARAALARYFEAADLVLPGLEDLQMLYGDASVEAALARLQSLGCRQAVLKAGAQDVHVLHDGRLTRLPVPTVAQPADLMGAGDALAAGCLAGLLEGRDLVDAARLGIAVAGLAIQLPGNIESMPTRAEVDRSLHGAANWKR